MTINNCNDISEKQKKINSLLRECRAYPAKSSITSEISQGQFIDAMRSLYHELHQLSNFDTQEDIANQSVDIFRQASEFIIYKMDRIIVSLDQEIEGPFADENYSHDWNLIQNTTANVENIHSNVERWIDKCLDLCGYGISLEVAVDCLRKVVKESNRKPQHSQMSISAVITSLRTIRRRLLVPESNCAPEHLVGILDTSRFVNVQNLRQMISQDASTQWLKILLPLEYYQNSQRVLFSEKEFLLSDSLVSLATSVVPPLISSACHAMRLPLPIWASRESTSLLLNSAFSIFLAANNMKEIVHTTSIIEEPPENDKIKTAASEYFQGVMKHVIIERNGAAVIRLLFQVFVQHQKIPTDALAILHSHFIDVLEAIPAKREVALFVRALVRYVVTKNKSKLLAQVSTANSRFIESELDSVCKDEVLPILVYFLAPLLASDSELVEAVINFVILSPPSSFKTTEPEQLSLHLCDQLIPRCILIMVHSVTCGRISLPFESESRNDKSFLHHLSTVAGVWCEEIFVSKAAILQQQHVTEFMLYPLQNQLLSQEEIELGLDNTGVSLAMMLIQVSLTVFHSGTSVRVLILICMPMSFIFLQGVSLRLEVSRAGTIRRDGMRIAEAMARIFDQTLNFDELHPPEEPDEKPEASPSTIPNKKCKKKVSKQVPHAFKKTLVVDPDAEVFSDDSDDESDEMCSNSDQSSYDSGQNSDESSWGEDSLEPYDIDDDEEDLRRVPRPRSLRDCVAYLLTNHEVREAYDKHEAALQELPALISSKPLDLMDVVPTLVRVLLHMEDKFNMDGFLENRYNSLSACAVQAPVEACCKLVEEMKGHVSLGTRLEALSIIGNAAEELSGHTNCKESARTTEGQNR